MKNRQTKLTRRRLIAAGAIAGLLPLPVVLGTAEAAAEGLPRLGESDPTAKALSYVHDATSVDAATRGGADRVCRTCRFYTDADAAPWGPCTLFPGKAVNVDGWCKGWVARAS